MPTGALKCATLPQLDPDASPPSPSGRRQMPAPPPPPQAGDSSPATPASSSRATRAMTSYLAEVARPTSRPSMGTRQHRKTSLEAAGVAVATFEEEFTRHRSERATASTRRVAAVKTAGMAEVVEISVAGSGASPIMARRRTMAAIAGGGFRGPASTPPRQCMCDLLRARLARAQSELRELRCGGSGRQSKATILDDPADDLELPEVPGAISAAAPVNTADAAVQVSTGGEEQLAPERHEVSVQASPPLRSVEAVEVQAGSGGLLRGEAASQAVPAVAEGVAQTEVSLAEGMALRAWPQPLLPAHPSTEAAVQTSAEATAEFATQAGAPTWHRSSIESQTEALATSEAVVQAVAASREGSTQTAGPGVEERTTCTRTSQTEVPPSISCAVQTAPQRGVDKTTQKEDSQAKFEAAKLEKSVKALTAEVADAATARNDAKEAEAAWRHMAQSKALGQLNVTILCPRAECTVNGERLEMDSWDPTRLRAEFERDVLPRFARLFVEEFPTAQKNRPRPEAVDRTMAEFAEVFRKRLTTMLAGPNAAAAVAGHSALVTGGARDAG